MRIPLSGNQLFAGGFDVSRQYSMRILHKLALDFCVIGRAYGQPTASARAIAKQGTPPSSRTRRLATIDVCEQPVHGSWASHSFRAP